MPAPSSESQPKSSSATGTILVVAVSMFVLGCILFFQYTPNALRWPLRVLWLAAVGWLVIAAVRAVRATRFTGRKTAFILVLGGFYYLVLSLVCHVFIKLMSQRDDRLTTRGMSKLDAECRRGIQAAIDDNQFNKFSAEVGWVPRPGYTTPSYTVNAQGLRGTREYPRQPAAPDRRILCMGDSFTFGIAVKDDGTYPAQAEQLLPGTEWLNFGIPGGCLVQAYQRYMHEARDYGGKRVVVGFMTNDAQRTVNIFRPFVNADSGCPLTKPFAKYDNGKFTIEPNPYHSLDDFKRLLADDRLELVKLQKLDYLTWSRQGGGPAGPISRTLLYVWDALRVDRSTDLLFDARLPLSSAVKSIIPPDPYGRDIWSPSSPGFKAICMMFDRFHEQIVADGREPLFVIIPGPMDVSDFTRQNPRQYLSLAAHFKSKGYAFVDFLDPLVSKHKADLSEDALFVRNHYQPPVNKELAAEIIKAMPSLTAAAPAPAAPAGTER
ncbi:MAG: hypothetical protein K1X78_05135 [Verrucomicrobiaceae bacterium]|nr:hypothetical protein [Verrucomicrobiaceae bacterium]